MKKIILGIILLTSITSFGQKIIKDETDEFTKAKLKTISWEYLDMNFSYTLSQQIRVVNDKVLLCFKIMPIITHIGVKDTTVLKLTNGEIITLYPIEASVSCKGCGAFSFAGSAAYGIGVSYYLSEDNISLLLNNKIEKLRIYTGNSDYIEITINDKRGSKFIDCLKLIK